MKIIYSLISKSHDPALVYDGDIYEINKEIIHLLEIYPNLKWEFSLTARREKEE